MDNHITLAVLATSGLVIMWLGFWYAVSKSKESIIEVLGNPNFFKVVVVMGVIATTAVLSLLDKLDGKMSATIISGIVGYVLAYQTIKH
jgi:uncharacterized membrane protein